MALASGWSDTAAAFWDMRLGKELPVRLPGGSEFRVARTVEGGAVALVFRAEQAGASKSEARLEVVDLTTGKVLSPPPALDTRDCPGLSYDGREMLFESSGAWRRRDLATGRVRESLWQSRRRAGHQALSRDGLEVLCGEIDYYLRSYDLATGLQRGGDLLREPQTGAWGSGSTSWTDYGLGEMVEAARPAAWTAGSFSPCPPAGSPASGTRACAG